MKIGLLLGSARGWSFRVEVYSYAQLEPYI